MLIVLVIQPDSPRGRWPLGRVIEVHPGSAGHTPVAKVVCGAKTVVRPITKLIPLGIIDSQLLRDTLGLPIY